MQKTIIAILAAHQASAVTMKPTSQFLAQANLEADAEFWDWSWFEKAVQDVGNWVDNAVEDVGDAFEDLGEEIEDVAEDVG